MLKYKQKDCLIKIKTIKKVLHSDNKSKKFSMIFSMKFFIVIKKKCLLNHDTCYYLESLY